MSNRRKHTCNCGAGSGPVHHEVSCRIHKNYEAEAPRQGAALGSGELTGSVAGFDVVDAQKKANIMVDCFLDGTPAGEANLRGAIAAELVEAYKRGQKK